MTFRGDLRAAIRFSGQNFMHYPPSFINRRVPQVEQYAIVNIKRRHHWGSVFRRRCLCNENIRLTKLCARLAVFDPMSPANCTIPIHNFDAETSSGKHTRFYSGALVGERGPTICLSPGLHILLLSRIWRYPVFHLK